MNLKYSFDDIMIQPAIISKVKSRKEVNVFDENGMLPLFTAPMIDVVSFENYKTYLSNRIYPILPREKDFKSFTNNFFKLGNDIKLVFVSCSLLQFEELVTSENIDSKLKILLNSGSNLLIDIANGHQMHLLNLIKIFKTKYINVKLMVGNIANPLTIKLYNELGVEFVRVGIANGSACETRLTGIGMSQAALIRETFQTLQDSPKIKTKIISDGGHQDFPDIIKALALGADYVQIGGLFNSKFESNGNFYLYKIKISKTLAKFLFKKGIKITKIYRGMSTPEMQKKISDSGKIKTTEGLKKYNLITGYLTTWTSDFRHYLSSAMSYCSKFELKNFKGQVTILHVTESSYKRIKK